MGDVMVFKTRRTVGDDVYKQFSIRPNPEKAGRPLDYDGLPDPRGKKHTPAAIRRMVIARRAEETKGRVTLPKAPWERDE